MRAKTQLNNQLILKLKYCIKVIDLDRISTIKFSKGKGSNMIDLWDIDGKNTELKYNYDSYNCSKDELDMIVQQDYDLILNSLIKYKNNTLHISTSSEK